MRLSYVLFALATFAFAPAYAADIEIDMMTVLKAADGTPMPDCDHFNQDNPQAPFCDKTVPLTLGRLAAAAVDQIEPNLKPDEIVSRGHLVREIRNAIAPLSPTKGKLRLDPRDIDLIKTQIAKMRLSPSTVMQAYEMLPPPATK